MARKRRLHCTETGKAMTGDRWQNLKRACVVSLPAAHCVRTGVFENKRSA